MRSAPVVALVLSLVVPRMASAQDASLPPLPPPAAPQPSVAPAPAPLPAPASTPASAPVPESEPAPRHTCVCGAYLHDGLYFRMAAGPSYTSLRGSAPASIGTASFSGGGFSLLLALGGTVGGGLVIGSLVDIAVAYPTTNAPGLPGADVGGVLSGLSLFADWYPKPSNGWHVGTELGFGLVELLVNSETLAAGDLTGSIFGGYEWWIGPQWSAGLMLKATGGTRTDLRYDQGDSSPGPQSGYVLGAGSIALEGTFLLH